MVAPVSHHEALTRMTAALEGTVTAGSGMVRVAAAPSVDTSQAIAGDVLSTTVFEFAGVPTAGYIEKYLLLNKEHAAASFLACDLHLFSATVTPAAANAAHALSDADAALLIGDITFASGRVIDTGANNSVLLCKGVNLAYTLASGSSLFGILVARATVTYTVATSLVPALVISQNPPA